LLYRKPTAKGQAQEGRQTEVSYGQNIDLPYPASCSVARSSEQRRSTYRRHPDGGMWRIETAHGCSHGPTSPPAGQALVLRSQHRAERIPLHHWPSLQPVRAQSYCPPYWLVRRRSQEQRGPPGWRGRGSSDPNRSQLLQGRAALTQSSPEPRQNRCHPLRRRGTYRYAAVW